MLGLLLARSGIEVTVLEKWPDFFRDFRGDTIHPSTMQVLRELGLFEEFLALPHNETRYVSVHIADKELRIADFTHLKSAPPFIGFIPQWDLLNFIAAHAKKYPNFHLLMATEATDLLREGGRVVGVRAKDAEGEFEIRSELVVGADGRHSTIREKSALAVEDLGAPIDVLWFSVPRNDDGKQDSLGYVNSGKLLVLINRDTYWQCAYIIQKGSFDELQAKGLETFRKGIADAVPTLTDAVTSIQGWEHVKLLSVAVDHLKTWYQEGLICIGDSAHAMSPVGGVGINLAIQDAVAAANILVPAFQRKGGVNISDLRAIERRRMWPARLVQRFQIFAHVHIIEKALNRTDSARVPWQLKLIERFPYLQRIPAWFIGIGVRPEHVRTDELRD
jgi:2-polyprenyl-6-methoxyphenol hydroxylase-like FAD-dependent oxidoreductase